MLQLQLYQEAKYLAAVFRLMKRHAITTDDSNLMRRGLQPCAPAARQSRMKRTRLYSSVNVLVQVQPIMSV